MPCYDIEGAEVACNDEATLASGEMSYESPSSSVSDDPSLLDYFYGGGSDSFDASAVGHAAVNGSETSGGSILNNTIKTLGSFGNTLVSGLTSQKTPVQGIRSIRTPYTSVGGTNTWLWIGLAAIAIIAIFYFSRRG
jgi:hypothetical protein